MRREGIIINLIEKYNQINWTKKKRLTVIIACLVIIFVLFLFVRVYPNEAEAITVQPQKYSERIVAVGQLQLAKETTLIAEVSGAVQFIGADEGDIISAGSIIISILDSDQAFQLDQKEANYQDADAQYKYLVEYDYAAAKEAMTSLNSKKEQAQKSYEAAASLYEEGAISQIEFMEYKTDYEAALADWKTAKLKVQSLSEGGSLRITAYSQLQSAQSSYESTLKNKEKYQIAVPWNSVLLKSYVDEQNYVQIGDALADIGEAGSYHVVTELDEKYFPYLSEGMKVLISMGDAGNIGEAEGTVDVITPKINSDTGTFEVKIGLPTEFPYQASDLTVNVEILIQEKENAIVIPEQYLVNNESYVYLYEGGKAVKTSIKYEESLSSKILVTEGIKKGDVIIKPGAEVRDGNIIKINKGDEAS